MEEQKDLPKPQTDLPLPRQQVPEHSDGGQAEKEIPAHTGGGAVSMSKWLKLGALLIVLLLIGGSTYLLSKNNASNNSPTPLVSLPPSPTPDPTADWKTYEGNGYSIKYPLDWSIRSSSDNDPSVYFNSSERMGESLSAFGYYVFSNVESNSNNLSFKEFATNGLEKEIKDNFEYTTEKLNGYDLYKTDDLPSGQGCLFTFITRDGLKYVNISLCPYSSVNPFEKQTKYVGIFNQMLSTFKFTDSSDETASWKIYTNQFFGYSLKYPQDWTVKDQNTKYNFNEAANKNLRSEFATLGSSNGMILSMELAENTNFRSSEDYLNFRNTKESEKISVDDITGKFYSTKEAGPMPTAGYYNWLMFFNNGKEYTFYLLSPTSLGSQEELMNQILSTFKFTK